MVFWVFLGARNLFMALSYAGNVEIVSYIYTDVTISQI